MFSSAALMVMIVELVAGCVVDCVNLGIELYKQQILDWLSSFGGKATDAAVD